MNITVNLHYAVLAILVTVNSSNGHDLIDAIVHYLYK